MARPKSYTDDDIINIATQLITKGKVPSGWYIKEILGRGKISTIQSDLERLIDSGNITSELQITVDAEDFQAEHAPLSYDLPAEVQALLARREEELLSALRDMTVTLNNKANEHYESLMTVRVRELDAKYNLAVRTKEQANTESAEFEERLKKQVIEKEELEDKIEDLEVELADVKRSNVELLQQNLELTRNLNSTIEKCEIFQSKSPCLDVLHSTLEEGKTTLAMSLEPTANDKHQSHLPAPLKESE
ncbi:DNA-binding protein [Vibrio mediterranei]|uniref:DNA-binding protein n=1 Tax=Vibrio mediterranei TaxID=689 RepID=UPI00148E882C|nr:DNA-binding protein [Vibrio mediterranei]NOH31626.1 hypothetical protein [Vibrio mediterranei]